MTISAHEEDIRGIAYLPGGERIVTRSHDNTIKLWNVENGEQQGRSMEHKGGGLAITKDGKMILSGGGDGRMRVLDVETQECIEEWESGLGHTIRCIAISPDGQFVASGGYRNILVRETKEGGQIKHSLQAGNCVESLCFSPKGEKLASCSFHDDHGIRVFDVESGELILGPIGYKYPWSVIWSLDGTRLFSAHGSIIGNIEIQCWNSENGELIGEPWTGHSRRVRFLSLSPDGTKIASASWDRTVRFWDAHSGDPIHQLLLHQSELRAVTFSPSGEFVAVGDDKGTLSIWRVPWWDETQKKVYDSLLDLPAVPAPKAPLSIDEFDFRGSSTRPTPRPLVRPEPIITRVQHFWRGLVARDSPSSPTLQTAELHPTSQEPRFWKSWIRPPVTKIATSPATPRIAVGQTIPRKNKKNKKKLRDSRKPSPPKTHADSSNAEADPSLSHVEPSGSPSHGGPSTAPATASKPAPEGRTSSFVQSAAGSDDSWDDMDSCDKCLDYFCGGPRPDRERFRPWRKKSRAVIQAEQQLKVVKRRARHTTKKAARMQKGHASPDEAAFEHLDDSQVGGAAPRRDVLQLQEPVKDIRRQRDDEVTARRKAEAERDGLLIEVMELRRMSHKSPAPLECQMHPAVQADPSLSFVDPSSRSNAGKGHGVHPPRHQDSQWDHTKAAPQPSPHTDEANPGLLGNNPVDGADPQPGTLQLQEQMEVIHRQIHEARKKADAEIDRLQKELFKEFWDINRASRELLERQTRSGPSVGEAGPSSSFAEPSCSTSNTGPSTSQARSSMSSSDPEGS
ncbi:quinon protein alcohol dehydrogenase-like superfamily [Melanogaster broomeanus]|nr:quinon protein alcohol dehydrogenase-like superfamily [Melanogaster broomeanus]